MAEVDSGDEHAAGGQLNDLSRKALAELAVPVPSALSAAMAVPVPPALTALTEGGALRAALGSQLAGAFVTTPAWRALTDDLAHVTAGPMLGINARLVEQFSVLPQGVLNSPALAAIATQSQLLAGTRVPANLLAGHAGLGVQLRDLLPKLASSLQLPGFAQLGAQLSAAGAFKNVIASDAVLATWRHSLMGSGSAAAFAATSRLRFDVGFSPLLAELTGTAQIASRLAATAAQVSVLAGAGVQLPSQRPAVSLGRYLRAMPPGASRADLAFAVSANRSVSGLLTVDVAAADLVEDEREQAFEAFTSTVAPAWLDGPARARADLFAALRELDPNLPGLLEGAWEDVERNGPAANVKIASCGVELLERALRALAPNGDVLAWHAGGSRSASELDTRGGPPSACGCATYCGVLRTRPGVAWPSVRSRRLPSR